MLRSPHLKQWWIRMKYRLWVINLFWRHLFYHFQLLNLLTRSNTPLFNLLYDHILCNHHKYVQYLGFLVVKGDTCAQNAPYSTWRNRANFSKQLCMYTKLKYHRWLARWLKSERVALMGKTKAARIRPRGDSWSLKRTIFDIWVQTDMEISLNGQFVITTAGL